MTEDQPWDRAATEQALSDEQSGSRNAHVMSAAGHVLCEAVKSYDLAAVEQAQDALMAAHDATTPSPNQTHVVVTVEEKALADAAKLVGKEWFAGIRPGGKPGHLAWNALLGAYRATLGGAS